jgi:LacI family transcriptional regulator
VASEPTAQDVADLAGVSRSAVSLVLNGRAEGNISPAKQEAVREAVRTLHYAPNAIALSLRTRSSKTLGVLLWGGPDARVWHILHAALTTAGRLGYLLLVVDTRGDPEDEEEAIDVLRARQVDGYLVISPDAGPYRPSAALHALPTVLANCRDPDGAFGSVTSERGEPDLLAAVGDQAVRLLLEELTSSRHEARSIVVG